MYTEGTIKNDTDRNHIYTVVNVITSRQKQILPIQMGQSIFFYENRKYKY